MSSQNNDAKISINQISNYILAEQNTDIKAYTVGHLNENHLFRPPEEKTHQPWQTAQKHVKLSSKSSKSLIQLTRKKQLSRVFTSTTTSPSSSACNLQEIFDELKSSQNFDKSALSSYDSNKLFSFTSKEDLAASGLIKLPRIQLKVKREPEMDSSSLHTENELAHGLPITDKEMALNYLTGPFKGATKTEKFKNFVKFEKALVQKEDLNTTNVLHSNESISWLEKKLQSVNINVLFVGVNKF